MIRRRWASWSARLLSVTIVTLALWAFWLEPASMTITRAQLTVPLQSGSLRVVVLTDLHVGSPFNGVDNLRRIISLANAEQPDLICILGDLVVQGVRGGRFVDPETIGAELSGLRASVGTFAVLGNHDNWLNHDRVANVLAGNGIPVIEERAVRLPTRAGPIWLAGISDYWMGRHDITAALSHVTDQAPVLLMTHNPDVFPSVPPRVALTLAGHTHGGQVRFPFIGAPVVPSEFGQRYVGGYVREGGRQMFVATGVGTSIIPVRFRVPPSIVVLTLISSPSAR